MDPLFQYTETFKSLGFIKINDSNGDTNLINFDDVRYVRYNPSESILQIVFKADSWSKDFPGIDQVAFNSIMSLLGIEEEKEEETK